MVVKNLNLVKLRYQEQDSLIINGEVVDNAGVIEGASVRLREENSRNYLSQAVTDVDGTYRFSFVPGKKTDYVVEIDKPGYLLYSVAVLHNETPNRFTNEEEINATRFNRIDVRSVLTGFSTAAWRWGLRRCWAGCTSSSTAPTCCPKATWCSTSCSTSCAATPAW
jgi:hypothetical protein